MSLVATTDPTSSHTPRLARGEGSRQPGGAQNDQGIGLISFLTALGSGSIIFLFQFILFLLLRNCLVRVFKSKKFLAPLYERMHWQDSGFVTTARWLWNVRDEETIKKCGLDAYFFLRYLQALITIFTAIAMVVIPVLVPLNYIDGRGSQLQSGREGSTGEDLGQVTGLDTLAWGNVRSTSIHRYWAHLVMSVVVVAWACFIFFREMKKYIEVRQSYLTSAEHRAKPSATTILVNSIPISFCDERKLKNLFSLFPGGVKHVWINRDFSSLAQKIDRRDAIHRKLEHAETILIKAGQQVWKKARKSALGPEEASKIVGRDRRAETASWGHGRPWSLVGRILRVLGLSGRDPKTHGHSNGSSGDCEKHGQDGARCEFLSKDDRPSHRLPLLGLQWLPGIAPFSAKVDTIDWCREELESLNSDIKKDQENPEKPFPLLDSAFIQFNSQVAAHMACQSEIHCLPEQMTPRIIGFCPKGIIWANMAVSYRGSWFRAVMTYGILLTMISLWSIPVAWTGALSQIDQLMENNSWLAFLEEREMARKVVQAIAGLLPTVMLTVFLYLLPLFLELLAEFKGVKTHSLKDEFVQTFYFAFLFIQIFLVVSIASFFTASIGELATNVRELQRASDVLDILARNLPKAANYFFSYMILQSLSASSATLLQVGTLITRYVIGPAFESTPRAKWLRHTKLNSVRWSAVFPVYTNFACIALVYCIISPLISAFAILTFCLLWAAQRYMILYVYQSEYDTGGVLYPRALNQTFTGLYVMELCLAGLFLIVKDEKGRLACTAQGIIMILVLIFTALYQIFLNKTFAPLFHYLPIQRGDYVNETPDRAQCIDEHGVSGCKSDGGSHKILDVAADTANYAELPTRLQEVPSPQKEILIRTAFEHSALRARRPVVWVPKDKLGISDDEIRQTADKINHVSMSNRGSSFNDKGSISLDLCPPDLMRFDRVRL